MKINFTLALALISSLAFSQSNCACCSSQHQSFNFWIGEWIVYDTLGNVVGENSVRALEDGCLISETWRSSQGSSGRSFNYYNTSDSTWNQVWVANNGNNLTLKGAFEGQKMVLTSNLTTSSTGNKYYNRITWALNSDSTVTQHWQILDEEKNALPVAAFKGIYKRK